MNHEKRNRFSNAHPGHGQDGTGERRAGACRRTAHAMCAGWNAGGRARRDGSSAAGVNNLLCCLSARPASATARGIGDVGACP